MRAMVLPIWNMPSSSPLWSSTPCGVTVKLLSLKSLPARPLLEEGRSSLETSSAYSLSIEVSASAAAFSLKPLSMLYASFCS